MVPGLDALTVDLANDVVPAERLTIANPDPRRTYRVEDTPPDLAGLLVAGLDRIIDGTDKADGK